MSDKKCSVCRAAFSCDATDPVNPCWCNTYPAIMPAEFEQDCRCPSCLARAIARHIETYLQTKSLDEMLTLAQPYKGQGTLIEHIDYTLENGLYIFSQWHHLKRGSCCGNGCRHCPYPQPSAGTVNQ